MTAARLQAFGKAGEVLRVEDHATPAPGKGEILVEMLAAPVNPADLNVIEGKYGELPELPETIGNEGAGRVAALGSDVSDFAVGDLVLPLARANWTSHLVVPAGQAVKLPAGLDPFQAAMLTVNPPSAWGMLEDFGTLNPGDWIVQNAANSAVGRCVIQIARSRGVRTLNVVRREELVAELSAIGADAVVLESVDLREVAPRICEGRLPKLALNAVGGASALNLANALADGGTVVTYGAMGRQPLKIPNGLLIFRGLSFQGFWLRRLQQDGARLRGVIGELAALSLAGCLHMPVHRVFGLRDVLAAVEEAGREQRSGKVLLDLRG
jgi:NADPH:quinone reductase-like Zn-dependent oxidoreductase